MAASGTAGPIISLDYIERTRRAFSERFLSGPGNIANALAQGATGPAPSLVVDEDGVGVIESPRGYEGVNKSILEVAGVDPDTFERGNQQRRDDGTPLVEVVKRLLTLALIAYVGVTLLGAVLQGVGEGLVS